MRIAPLAALFALTAASAATADEPSPPPQAIPPASASLTAPPDDPDPKASDDRTHRFQGGLGVTVGSGYRVIFRYGDTKTCGTNDPQSGAPTSTCSGRLPTWLDAKLFFGVAHSVDLVIEQRFGLEADFTLNRQFMLMPGIRVYASDPHKPFKFFVQIQGVFDYSDPSTISDKRFDFGIHEANGFQWDFLKWMGAYLQISETFEFYRGIDFQIEGGLGLEGRFP